MGTKDPRIDAYIANAADFARPILEHLREVVHKACPDVAETVKWSMPHFDYKGPLCHMSSFKAHCAFGFWKGSLMSDPKGLFEEKESAMGHLGRITSLKDLPSTRVLTSYIKEAMKLNDEGVKVPKSPAAKKGDLVLPDYLVAALRKNKKAQATFDGFSPSHKREYVEWVTEAKTDATREKRLATAVEWMSEGKSRHWKYAKK